MHRSSARVAPDPGHHSALSKRAAKRTAPEDGAINQDQWRGGSDHTVQAAAVTTEWLDDVRVSDQGGPAVKTRTSLSASDASADVTLERVVTGLSLASATSGSDVTSSEFQAYDSLPDGVHGVSQDKWRGGSDSVHAAATAAATEWLDDVGVSDQGCKGGRGVHGVAASNQGGPKVKTSTSALDWVIAFKDVAYEDETQGRDDPVLTSTSTSSACKTHDDPATQGFLFKYAAMLAIGITGASPRALVLLLSRLVPSVSVDQALSDFPVLWAPCAKEGAAYTAYSPDGSLYKYLIGTDFEIRAGSTSLALFGAGMAIMAPDRAGSRASRWYRGIRRCAALINVLGFLAITVTHVYQLMLAPTTETLLRHGENDEKVLTFFVALIFGTLALLSLIDARELTALSKSHAMTRMDSVALVARKTKVFVLLAVRPLLTSVRLPSNVYTRMV